MLLCAVYDSTVYFVFGQDTKCRAQSSGYQICLYLSLLFCFLSLGSIKLASSVRACPDAFWGISRKKKEKKSWWPLQLPLHFGLELEHDDITGWLGGGEGGGEKTDQKAMKEGSQSSLPSSDDLNKK